MTTASLPWYVLRVQSGREDKIREAIERRIASAGLTERVLRVLVPTETVSEIKGGKRRVSRRKIFPGYLVLQMEMTDDVWYVIRDTPGVGDFLGAHGKPTLMQPHEVEKILGEMQTGAEKPKLKRAMPELTSVPTMPINSPRATIPSDFTMSPCASTAAVTRPISMSEKYSAAPNSSATSASGGPNSAIISVHTVPAKNEPMAAIARAGPARPCFAI